MENIYPCAQDYFKRHKASKHPLVQQIETQRADNQLVNVNQINSQLLDDVDGKQVCNKLAEKPSDNRKVNSQFVKFQQVEHQLIDSEPVDSPLGKTPADSQQLDNQLVDNDQLIDQHAACPELVDDHLAAYYEPVTSPLL